MNERNTLKPSCRLGAVYGGCLLSCQPLVGELKGPFLCRVRKVTGHFLHLTNIVMDVLFVHRYKPPPITHLENLAVTPVD